ncbi:GNAT family N-acetyltransferase [Alteribacillus sp. HJP-4]|uniref:GNAT family N-acetyltransferase n=1 Tax=Alteribacillus sp. HJP-4 TaxID=2775394 RepID=UPI0035CD38E5
MAHNTESPVFSYRRYSPVLGQEIQFRKVIETEDFSLLHEWMHNEHVIPFWQLNFSREEYKNHLQKALADTHQSLYIGCLNGRSMSYWEAYWAADDIIGRYYHAQPYDQGIHLLIGPESDIGKGYALPLLEEMTAFLFEDQRTTRVVAEPDIRNDKMIHVFKQCGFEPVKPVDLPDKRGLFMVCRRETFERMNRHE